jgi:Ca2+-binding EF-hand superfamily protein
VAAAQEKIHTMFKKHDQDGNGGIDKREFHQLLAELGFFTNLPIEKQQQVRTHTYPSERSPVGLCCC